MKRNARAYGRQSENGLRWPCSRRRDCLSPSARSSPTTRSSISWAGATWAKVYRAHDRKLGRDVAIKVLPDELAENGERLRRFQREAKVLASLNHPNIAAIYGLEQEESTHYLIFWSSCPAKHSPIASRAGRFPGRKPSRSRRRSRKRSTKRTSTGSFIGILKPANVKNYFETGPEFSPDGRFIVYASRQSGQYQVHVEPFPGPGEAVPISTEGGSAPRWSPDGRTIYYHHDGWMMAADVPPEPLFRVSEPLRLFESDYVVGRYAHDIKNYDVTPDSGFVFIRYDRNPAPTRLHVVLNWVKELERLVPLDAS